MILIFLSYGLISVYAILCILSYFRFFVPRRISRDQMEGVLDAVFTAAVLSFASVWVLAFLKMVFS